MLQLLCEHAVATKGATKAEVEVVIRRAGGEEVLPTPVERGFPNLARHCLVRRGAIPGAERLRASTDRRRLSPAQGVGAVVVPAIACGIRGEPVNDAASQPVVPMVRGGGGRLRCLGRGGVVLFALLYAWMQEPNAGTMLNPHVPLGSPAYWIRIPDPTYMPPFAVGALILLGLLLLNASPVKRLHGFVQFLICAAVENLAHSASFHSQDNNAPSNPGIKQLVRPLDVCAAVPHRMHDRQLYAITQGSVFGAIPSRVNLDHLMLIERKPARGRICGPRDHACRAPWCVCGPESSEGSGRATTAGPTSGRTDQGANDGRN